MSLDQRLSGVVRLGGTRAGDLPRRRGESATVFALSAVVYAVVGLWLVRDVHAVDPDTLDRWGRALAVWHGSEPGLGAVGVDHPPLSVLLLAPFTISSSLATSQVVIPLVSAVSVGFVMVVLNTMMRRAALDLPVRIAALAALGLNPLVVVRAATGGQDVMWLALVVAALGALVAWYVTADVRFVMIAGLAFSGAAMTGYASLAFFLVSAVAVASIVRRLGADRSEVEGTTVGFASPTVYLVVVWTVVHVASAPGDPFWWLGGGDGASVSLADAVRDTGAVVLQGAPIALVVLPALAVAGVAHRNALALWLGVLLLVAIVLPGLAVLAGAREQVTIGDALPTLLLSVVGAVWLARSALARARLVAGLLAAGLLLSVPWTFSAMADAPRHGVERAFHDAVVDGPGS